MKERNKIEDIICNLEETGLRMPLRESIHEFSSYDNHPADIATETFERSKDMGLLENAKRILKRICRAEKKLQDGSYGYCDDCHQPIGQSRIDVLPYAITCVECQEENEMAQKRPQEEEMLYPPFARSWRDDRFVVGKDGEDFWQAVERFGTASTPQDDITIVRSPQLDEDDEEEKQGSVYFEDKQPMSYDKSKRVFTDPKDESLA